MLREVARRLATAVILFCAVVMAFSLVVASAYRGDLGGWATALTSLDFEVWVAAFETALAVGGIALVALLLVRTEEGAPDEPDVVERVLPEACPSCTADLSDMTVGPEDPFPECPNCGLDLFDEMEGSVSVADEQEPEAPSGKPLAVGAP